MEQLRILLQQIGTIEFWEQALQAFQGLGPVVPVLLAALESFIPALPLVGIVAVNVMAHGPLLGFVYSWAGTCIGCTCTFWFFRKLFWRFAHRMADKHQSFAKAKAWVSRMRPASLFVILIMPFTPSSFVNFAFGISDFAGRKYLYTLYAAKLIMIGLLAAFGQSVTLAMDHPLYLALSVGLLAVLYWLSKKISSKYDL